MNKRNVTMIVLFIGMMVVSFGCQKNTEQGQEQNQEIAGEKPIVTMTMEDGDDVEMELYPNVAPNTVDNFIALVEDGFYDGLTFHRIIPSFMIQGGDPEGTGLGEPGYAIAGEFSSNGFDNELEHEPGVLSMARSQDPDSAGSQFFIVTGDASHLDGDYAAFGKVTSGMDVVEEIAAVESDNNNQPVNDQVIASMAVDLNGYEASEPEKITTK